MTLGLSARRSRAKAPRTVNRRPAVRLTTHTAFVRVGPSIPARETARVTLQNLLSKAAASEDSRRTLWYIEPLSDARMKLAGLFGVLLGAVVEGERSHCRIVTRTIDFDGEIGAGD